MHQNKIVLVLVTAYTAWQ